MLKNIHLVLISRNVFCVDCAIIEGYLDQKLSAVCEAKGIRIKFKRLETAFMIVFWGFVLVYMIKTKRKDRLVVELQKNREAYIFIVNFRF